MQLPNQFTEILCISKHQLNYNEELLPSGSFDRLQEDKISIPPLATITFWQTGISLLNLGEENRGRQLISNLKSVLAEGENKFYLLDDFE